MDSFVIEDCVRVSAPHMKKVAVLPCVKKSEGENVSTYVKIAKADYEVYHLLGIEVIPLDRTLSKSTIIEQLIALREERRQELNEKGETGESNYIEEASIFATQRKKRPADKSALPDVISIDAPTVGDVEGITMKVMMGKSREPLNIELTRENVLYLAKVSQQQIESGVVKNARGRHAQSEEHRIDTGEVGVSVVYSGRRQGAVRISVNAEHEKAKRTKYVMPEEGQGISCAIETAITLKRWLVTKGSDIALPSV